MLRSTIPFFKSASRQYAVGSAKHLELQAELSQQVTALHFAQSKMREIPAIQTILIDFRENIAAEIISGKADPTQHEESVATMDKARYILAGLENEKLCQTDNQEKISERMLKIVRDIREECANEEPAIHAVAKL